MQYRKTLLHSELWQERTQTELSLLCSILINSDGSKPSTDENEAFTNFPEHKPKTVDFFLKAIQHLAKHIHEQSIEQGNQRSSVNNRKQELNDIRYDINLKKWKTEATSTISKLLTVCQKKPKERENSRIENHSTAKKCSRSLKNPKAPEVNLITPKGTRNSVKKIFSRSLWQGSFFTVWARNCPESWLWNVTTNNTK